MDAIDDLNVSNMPPEVILEGDARLGGVDGDVDPGWDATVSLDATSPAKRPASIEVGPAPADVAFAAHAHLERSGTGGGATS